MDQPDFQALYKQTAPGLRAYLRVSTGSGDLADDLLQECYCRLIQHAPTGLNAYQMRAYLYKTAASQVAERWRTAKREALWRIRRTEPDPAPPDPDLERDVMKCFRELKPRQQTLLWMAYVEGFPHREIAAAMNLREASVRVLLDRSRRKLASILARRGLAPEGMS